MYIFFPNQNLLKDFTFKMYEKKKKNQYISTRDKFTDI